MTDAEGPVKLRAVLVALKETRTVHACDRVIFSNAVQVCAGLRRGVLALWSTHLDAPLFAPPFDKRRPRVFPDINALDINPDSGRSLFRVRRIRALNWARRVMERRKP